MLSIQFLYDQYLFEGFYIWGSKCEVDRLYTAKKMFYLYD